MKRYKVVLRARKGFLLGGAKVHESSWFETEKDAEHFLSVISKANDVAGRNHDGGKVVSRWTKIPLGKKSINGTFSKRSTQRNTTLVSPAAE